MADTPLLRQLIILSAIAGAASACANGTEKSATPDKQAPTQQTQAGAKAGAAASTAAKPAPSFDRVKRMDFNRIAAELDLPIFWVEDKDKNNAISPDELAVLWGVRASSRDEWIAGGQFSPAFTEAYERMVKLSSDGYPLQNLDENEAKRRKAVLKELSQGRPTVVASSFKGASEEDRALVKNMLEAAQTIEKIYAKQSGSFGMADQIPAEDTASKMMFYRNQSPWCVAPETESDPDCNALPSKPKRMSGLYPESVQKDDPKFCETLAKRKDAKALLHQFVTIAEEDGKLKAVPYNEAYKAEMEAVSKSLKAAADAINSAEEASLKAYLNAASQSFLTNEWNPADEAWAKMNSQNSKWYARVAPDETYHEPCSTKAGFHVSFARINQASVEWQNKLDPIKNDMENALAVAAGKPYKARKVSFHLPDFIDVVVNAGDSRDPHGATIGQSLPNWGPVAEGGRGRTVAMTNFYTDADSISATRTQVESLFCASSMTTYSDEQGPMLMTTVLHEATHNLGPAHEYKVSGKVDREVFGGPVAAMLEELKAQTGADFFTDWLLEKGLINKDFADKAHTRDVSWGFGHISRGMYENGKPRPYSQLAAIQFGFLVKEGAVSWNADEPAANKTDKGCMQLNLDKFAPAYKKLMSTVAGIKARGDKKGVEALVKEFVDKDGQTKMLLDTIKERWLRSPKASFVYSIDM